MCYFRSVRIVILVFSGLALFVLWLSLAIWSNQAVPVNVFGMLAIQLLSWGIVLGVWVKFKGQENGGLRVLILGLAILMRLPSFYATPIYEDDYFRFLWDGWNFLTTGTPYNGAPELFFDEPGYSEPLQRILYNVNYPEVPTIYAPICQVFFALAAALAPLKLWSLRLVLMVMEFLVIISFSRSVTLRQLILLAWCPLLVFESMFQVHPDFLAASFLCLAFIMRRRESHALTGLFCAFALGIKITVLPALTFLLWPLRRQGILVFLATCLIMYLPFRLQGSRADFDGLLVFAREWEFNASLYSLGASYFPRMWVKGAMLGIFTTAFFTFWFLWQRKDSNENETARVLVAVYGVFFLVSPVVNSWYLLLILPFVSLNAQAWSVAALGGVSLSYIRGQTLPHSSLNDFEQPTWIVIMEYVSILGLLAYPIIPKLFMQNFRD